MVEIDFPYVTIRYKEPVIYLIFKEGAELDVKEVKEMTAAAEELAKKKPYLLYSDARVFLQITSEGRKLSADKNHSPLVVANAVMVNNLAIRLTGNMFVRLNKPHFPLRLFEDEKKAMEWLLSHKLEK